MKKTMARLILFFFLFSLLPCRIFASETDFRYALESEYFSHNLQMAVNGADADGYDRLVLTEDDAVSLLLSFSSEKDDFSDYSSKFLRFSSSEDGLISTTFVRRDALVLPDGSYAAILPQSEALSFDQLQLAEEKNALTYSFCFEGEYQAVPVTLEEIRACEELGAAGGAVLWQNVDTSDPYRLLIRAEGSTLSPVALERELTDQTQRWYFALAAGANLSAYYEINVGNGWEPFEAASWHKEGNDRTAQLGGRNFFYDSYPFSLSTAYGETPTIQLLNPVAPQTAAAAAAAAAVSALVISSAANTAGSGSLQADSSAKRSILINGGGAYPSLVNTAKATVELFLTVDNNLDQIYKWVATATAPDCLKAVTAAAVPPFGQSCSAVVMLTGEKLPKDKIPVFLEITAIGFDGEKLTASAELTLYEKGVFAQLKDSSCPKMPESYTVTKVSDANLDGIAEVKQLSPVEYSVEIADGTPIIRVEGETILPKA